MSKEERQYYNAAIARASLAGRLYGVGWEETFYDLEARRYSLISGAALLKAQKSQLVSESSQMV
jgi:hypothetical protein